jgi:hypothetical protein
MNPQQIAVFDAESSEAGMQARTASAAISATAKATYIAYGFLALILLLTAAVRFHLRNIPLERDEGEYAYAGQLMLQGIAPYKLAYNMKLPGTYAAYALIMSVFGETTAGIHLGVLVLVLATMLVIAALGWRLAGPVAAVAAAGSYGLMSASSTVMGFCGHATHFVLLPALSGILVFLEAIKRQRMNLFFWSGALLSLGVLMKQPGILFVFFAAAYLLRIQVGEEIRWKTLGRSFGFYVAGLATPFLVTCLVLWRAGVFSTFWFWTVSYASQYASNYKFIKGLFFFDVNFTPIVMSALGIWIFAIFGIVAVALDKSTPHQYLKFLLGFLVFSFLAVCPTLAFRPHYFILLLPAIALLAGFAVSSATRRLQEAGATRALIAAPSLLFALALLASFYQQRKFFVEDDPIAACRDVYNNDPFPEAVIISDYIRQHTPENASIAVLGSEPEIYFYSHRHSATGYIYTYGLMEEQKYALEMQHQMIAEVERARPEILVFVNLWGSWAPAPHANQMIYAWARKYIQDHYETVGVIDVPAYDHGYHFDDAAKTYKPHSADLVFVFKKRNT